MEPRTARSWRIVVAGLLLASLVGGIGCSANGGGGTDTLAPAARSLTTMDGFVFVPSRSRQTAQGDTSIPHALIAVYIMPRQPADLPIATTQADATGYYQIENLRVNVPLLIVARDPFDPNRTLRAAISFTSEGEVKQRNVTPTSTVAAGVLENRNTSRPVSDAQVSALEQLAAEKIDALPLDADPTADQDLLDEVIADADDESYGEVVVTVHSDPSVEARVLLNGAQVGTVITSAPPTAREEDEPWGPDTLELSDVPIGTAVVRLEATGFLADETTADVVGGETLVIERTLARQPAAGDNLPPVIVTARVIPATLPFQGGTVSIQAQARDPENDPLTGVAHVYLGSPEDDELVADLDLTPVGDTWSAPLTVPGNPNDYNETYVVVIEFTDGAGRPVTRRVVTFQVSGIVAPPAPPDAEGARQLVGTWTEQQVGTTLEDLTTNIGTPNQLVINADGTYRLTTDEGEVSGHVEMGVGREQFAMSLVVETTAGGMPPIGVHLPILLELVDANTLFTYLYPFSTGQIVTQWTRVVPAG